ncbi:MAG: hypothetical protein R3B96_24945 [Pirellulaceae bacterium]
MSSSDCRLQPAKSLERIQPTRPRHHYWDKSPYHRRVPTWLHPAMQPPNVANSPRPAHANVNPQGALGQPRQPYIAALPDVEFHEPARTLQYYSALAPATRLGQAHAAGFAGGH